MSNLTVKERFIFPTLYKGEKKSNWPVHTCGVDIIERQDFFKRSRRNLEVLEELYDIEWYKFFRYTFAIPAGWCGYVAHGMFGKHKVTYYMYKHSGSNMGDVFFYFKNGKRLHNAVIRDLELINWVEESTESYHAYKKPNLQIWMNMVLRRLFHPKSTLSIRSKTNLAVKLIDKLDNPWRVKRLKKWLLEGGTI